MNLFKTLVIAASLAVTTLATAYSTAADASTIKGFRINGTELNGFRVNGPGLVLQGINIQGINIQGTKWQGINIQGTKFQGHALNGITATNAGQPMGLTLADGRRIDLR